MGNMRFYDEAGNSANSLEDANSGEAIVSAQGDLIYSGPFKTDFIGTHSVVFRFKGTESDIKGDRDFMVIWDITRHMVIFPDKDGHIRTGYADWVQGDEYLEWEESVGNDKADILIESGAYPGEGTIADKLDDILLEVKSDISAEIASYVGEMVYMVRTGQMPQ